MAKVIAYKTNKTTATGKTIYAVDVPECHEDRELANFEVSDAVGKLACGDDGWANVLCDMPQYIILNEQGQIDIDVDSIPAFDSRESEEWDENDDDYIDD